MWLFRAPRTAVTNRHALPARNIVNPCSERAGRIGLGGGGMDFFPILAAEQPYLQRADVGSVTGDTEQNP